MNAPVFTITLNPGQQQAVVTSDIPMKDTALMLVDPTGRHILRERMNGHTHVLDLRSLRAGLYVLTVASEHDVISRRLVIE